MRDSPGHLLVHSIPPSNERLPLFIVGDVHGCAQELSEIIQEAKKHLSPFQLVLVGDLFTKGPDPLGVFDIIQEHNALCVKGNHDWALARAIVQQRQDRHRLFSAHLQQTLRWIHNQKYTFGLFLDSLPHAYKTTTVPLVTRTHWESTYPTLVLHAGLNPIAGLEGTTERMVLTARYVRYDDKSAEKNVVLVPSSVPKGTTLVSHEWDKVKFRWHEIYHGPDLVVFGHDAKQGLFRKTLPSGRPVCVGLDSGCTYGSSLTGYFPELDVAIQVRSHRRYFDSQTGEIVI